MQDQTEDTSTLTPEAVRARAALHGLRWSLSNCFDAITDPGATNAWNIDWRTFKRMFAGRVPMDPHLLTWLEGLARAAQAVPKRADIFARVERRAPAGQAEVVRRPLDGRPFVDLTRDE